MYEVKICFQEQFLFAAWNIGFAFCAASLVGKIVSKETKWRYDRVKNAACRRT